MTVYSLQKALIKDIENALEYIPLSCSENKEKRIKAYPQALPIVETQLGWDDESSTGEEGSQEDKIFPYVIVRIEGAKYQEEGGQASVYLLFGLYNNSPDMSGYSDLMNVIETIVNRYRGHSVIGEFYCDRKMSVAIQEDDAFPYFFGGIEMTWNLPRMEMEGELYG